MLNLPSLLVYPNKTTGSPARPPRYSSLLIRFHPCTFLKTPTGLMLVLGAGLEKIPIVPRAPWQDHRRNYFQCHEARHARLEEGNGLHSAFCTTPSPPRFASCLLSQAQTALRVAMSSVPTPACGAHNFPPPPSPDALLANPAYHRCLWFTAHHKAPTSNSYLMPTASHIASKITACCWVPSPYFAAPRLGTCDSRPQAPRAVPCTATRRRRPPAADNEVGGGIVRLQ